MVSRSAKPHAVRSSTETTTGSVSQSPGLEAVLLSQMVDSQCRSIRKSCIVIRLVIRVSGSKLLHCCLRLPPELLDPTATGSFEPAKHEVCVGASRNVGRRFLSEVFCLWTVRSQNGLLD